MKKTLIALMALASVAAAGGITLDSGKGGSEASLYEDIVNGTTTWVYNDPYNSNAGVYTTVLGAAFSFYIDVEELFGASALLNGATYTLDTFSYIGNDNGWYAGTDRTWTLSNGTDTVTFVQDSASNKFHTTDFTKQAGKELLTFKKGDILTLTLTPPSNGSVSANYYDTNAPGVSFAMKDGEVNDGIDHNINPGTTNWKYNSPAVRLTARLIPEPTTATLSLLALAGLAARRRRASR